MVEEVLGQRRYGPGGEGGEVRRGQAHLGPQMTSCLVQRSDPGQGKARRGETEKGAGRLGLGWGRNDRAGTTGWLFFIGSFFSWSFASPGSSGSVSVSSSPP